MQDNENHQLEANAWLRKMPRFLRYFFFFFIAEAYNEERDRRRAIILLNLFFFVLGVFTLVYLFALTLQYWLGTLGDEFIEQYFFWPYIFLAFVYAGGKTGTRRIYQIPYQRRGEYFVFVWWVVFLLTLMLTIALMLGVPQSPFRAIREAVLWRTWVTTFWVTIALIASTATKRWRELFGKWIPTQPSPRG